MTEKNARHLSLIIAGAELMLIYALLIYVMIATLDDIGSYYTGLTKQSTLYVPVIVFGGIALGILLSAFSKVAYYILSALVAAATLAIFIFGLANNLQNIMLVVYFIIFILLMLMPQAIYIIALARGRKFKVT